MFLSVDANMLIAALFEFLTPTSFISPLSLYVSCTGPLILHFKVPDVQNGSSKYSE